MNAKTIGRVLCGALVLAGVAAGAQDEGQTGAKRVYGVEGVTQDAKKLLADIAALRVSMDVDGDLGGIRTALSELALRASDVHGFEGQAEALAQIALASAQLHERMGDFRQALAALEAVQPPNLRVQGDVKLVAASKALLDALELARKDTRLAEFRARLQRAAGQGSDRAEGSLKSVIDDALQRNDWNRIVNIGPPAAGYVAEVALDSAGGFPSQAEPLYYLVKIDERFATRFLLQHFDAGGVLWKKRILSALRANNALDDPGTWTSNEPVVCLEPELLRLLERLLGVPETATEVLAMLAPVEQHDAWTEGLVAAVVHGLATFGGEFATALMQLFDGEAVAVGARPVLEAALALPDARLRRLAAEKLTNFERSEALLARVDEADAGVRTQIAGSLGRHGGQLLRQGHSRESVDWKAPIATRDVPVLRRLLADADEGVREAATWRLNDLETPLEDAAYDKLTKDPSPRVRVMLVWVERLAPDVRARLLGVLALDPAAQVVEQVDRVLRDACGPDNNVPRNSELAKDPHPYLPALEARFAARTQPLGSDLRVRLRAALAASNEGLRALVAWTLAGSPTPVLDLVNLAEGPRFLALPDEHLARLLATADRAWNGHWDDVWRAVRDAQPRRAAAMRLLLADSNASRTVRLAAALLATDGTPAFRDALLKLLELPTWKDQPLDKDERQELAASAQRLAKSDRNGLALAVLRDDGIPIDVAATFVGSYPLDAPGGRELTQAVLERWFRPEVPTNDAVGQAISHLGALPDLARPELLQRALLVPAYADAAVEAMAGLRDRAYLPALGRALQAEWMPVNWRNDLQFAAAQALASYTDDAAAEYLLEGLKASDDGVRTTCKDGLDRLEEYDKRTRAWRDRGVAPPTKENALAELVGMLSDKDAAVRRQAALGLATLGAVETIPQLIRLLKDPDAGVSQAAQQALERLNQAKKDA